MIVSGFAGFALCISHLLWLNIVGALLLLFGEKLDCVDGEVARWNRQSSLRGTYFYETGSFKVAPPLDHKGLEKLFRSKVLNLLLAKGKITPGIITLLDSWKHTGFTVFCGHRIYPVNDTAMENLARISSGPHSLRSA